MQSSCRIIKDNSIVQKNHTVLEFKKEFLVEEIIDVERTGEDLEKEVENIIASAQQKANAIEAAALANALQIEEQARAKGYAEGHRAASDEGKQIVIQATKKAEEIISDVEGFRRKTLAELKEDIKELIVLIAEKVIISEIDRDSTVIQNIVENAIEEVNNRERIQIFVAPKDRASVEEIRQRLIRKNGFASLDIFEDTNLSMGGCRIKSEKGWVDATIETQLEELKKIITE